MFQGFQLEHEVFVAFLKTKPNMDQDTITDRFIATFLDLIPGVGVNAHAKFMNKMATCATFVGMMVSRWAPVQNPSESFQMSQHNLAWLRSCMVAGLDIVRGYSWGPALLEEFPEASVPGPVQQ